MTDSYLLLNSITATFFVEFIRISLLLPAFLAGENVLTSLSVVCLSVTNITEEPRDIIILFYTKGPSYHTRGISDLR